MEKPAQNNAESLFPELYPESYAELARSGEAEYPLSRVIHISREELNPDAEGMLDPIGEGRVSPLPHLLRKYRDRALYLSTGRCVVHCRFCFRRASSLHLRPDPEPSELAAAAKWVGEREDIREVIISGGDPLALPASALKGILATFGALPNIERLRVHTRAPLVEPALVKDDLLEVLANTPRPLTVMLHAVHPSELRPQTVEAIGSLAGTGVRLLSQSVLLKGVNADTGLLADLFSGLGKCGVKPRYLHHPDRVKGGSAFRLSIREGLALFGELTGSLCKELPQYVLDLPNGSGKTRVDKLMETGQEKRGGSERRRYLWRKPDDWRGVLEEEAVEWWDIWE